MARKGSLSAAVLAMGAFVLAACGSSPSSSPPTSTTAIAPAAALATGTYVPAGASGTPHYVVVIGSAEGTAFRGTMNFVYQDGTSSRVFDFTGSVRGQSATATPTIAPDADSTTKTLSSLPATLRIDIAPDMLTLTGCQDYLSQTQSPAACSFTMSR